MSSKMLIPKAFFLQVKNEVPWNVPDGVSNGRTKVAIMANHKHVARGSRIVVSDLHLFILP